MTTPASTWTETFRVRAYETDPTGAVSVPTLCNFLQEVASNHAQALGVSVEQLTAQQLTWVLSRLHVEVASYPQWRETVRVETWPSGVEGLYATREFMIYDGEAREIGRGTSAWLMIDVARRRPVRIPDFITAIRRPERGRVLPDTFERLPAPKAASHSHDIRVRYSDLDLNQHVNNVRYVAWALEALPAALLQTHRLTTLEVHFRAETSAGALVGVQAEPASDEPGTYLHRVFHASDGRDAAVVRTRWRAQRTGEEAGAGG